MSADPRVHATPPTSSPATVASVPVPALPDLAVPAGLPSSLLPPTDLPPALVHRSKLRRAARYWPAGFLGCGLVVAVFWFGRPKGAAADLVTAPVVRGDLPVVVTERGE